jgi:predicted transcriptional regulator
LFKKPIISASELAKNSNIKSSTTSNNIFKKLLNHNLISVYKKASGTNSAIFSFNELIKIIDN